MDAGTKPHVCVLLLNDFDVYRNSCQMIYALLVIYILSFVVAGERR
jgi:hypothetical protein